MLRASLCGVLVLATLSSCGGGPKSGLADSGAAGPHLATRMCVFHVDGKTKQARLRVEFAVIRSLPPGSVIEMQFENTGAPAAPLVASRVATGAEKTLEMVSPPLTAIRVGSYETVARVYSSADRTQLLSTHVQACHSPFDQRDLGPPFR